MIVIEVISLEEVELVLKEILLHLLLLEMANITELDRVLLLLAEHAFLY